MENVQARQSATKSDQTSAILSEVFPSNEDLVDAHLTSNNFGMRDIYAAFRPNGKFTKEATDGLHGTYRYAIGGDFIGTPDIRLNLEDILSKNCQ